MTRPLTRAERIRARHLLQELSEQARSVRNAMDPLHGMLAFTDEAWAGLWASLTKALDGFTEAVAAGRTPVTAGGDDPG